MAIVNGYVMQEYEGTGEYHLYDAKYNEETERITLNTDIPLCGGGLVLFDYNSEIYSCRFKTESGMAKFCGEQKSAFRHKICAKCVGRFYRTC